MLQRLNDVPRDIDALKAIGRVSRDDYETVMEPLLDQARREGRRVRFLYQFGPEFEGFTAGAAWEDAKVGLHNMTLFQACAIVTDVTWIRDATRLASFMMPCPVRVFPNRERDQAVAWLASLQRPTSAATTA